jgi:hypothetical protein
VAESVGDVRAEAVDVNGDGLRDLRVEFRVDRLRFSAIDTVADVWGQTRGGNPFAGSDLVIVIGAP